MHRCVTNRNHKSIKNIVINNIRPNTKHSCCSFRANLNNMFLWNNWDNISNTFVETFCVLSVFTDPYEHILVIDIVKSLVPTLFLPSPAAKKNAFNPIAKNHKI